MRALADYGDSKHPPADSVLAQAVANARAYADHLDQDVAPQAANVLIVPGTNLFETADALAQLIIDEGTSGAYGDPSPPGETSSTPFPWVPVGIALALGLAAAAVWSSQGRRGGLLGAVGL